jgi:outer membrane protein OmpA-like peptidoglycan-associated protein
MKNTLYLLVIGTLLLVSNTGYSQTKKAWLKAADESFEEKNYYSALTFYSEALEFDTSNMDVRFKVAESARMFNAYSLAVENYKEVLKKDEEDKYPDVAFHLADMYMMLGNYEEALTHFNIYLGEHRDENEALTAKSEEAIETIAYAKEKIENFDESIVIERLGENVNTPYSEFASSELGTTLYYSSHQFEVDDKTRLPNKYLGKLMKSADEEDGAMLDGGLDIEGKSLANSAFNRDGTKIYYSVCDYVNANDIRCDLYVSDVVDDSTFTNAKILPPSINDTSFTSTQPHVAYDDLLGAEYLFFVSDRPGGKGKKDIYYTIIDGDDYAEIVNIESINTSGNDISPYFNITSQTLYFSSDGRKGLGGYDVYSADAVSGDFENIQNLDAHINSSYNDIYYRMADSEEYALFSSNRKGSLFLEDGQEACCYDIYKASFDVQEIELNAMTFDLLTRDSLTGVLVRLLDAKTGREIDRKTGVNTKDHKFKVKNQREYIIISELEGYYIDTTVIATGDFVGVLEKEIYLDSERFALDVQTFDKRSLAPLKGVQVRLVDLTDLTIADQVQTNQDTNQFLFILEPNKKYRVEASKYGYVTDIGEVSTIGKLESKRIKLDLFLDGFDLNQYLPVSLYFDNDMPDPGALHTSTDKVYSELYYQYIEQEENFKKRNPNERDRLESFFAENVKEGYVRMQKFYDELYKSMKEGIRINLTIKGHTSPIAVNKYNLVLGQRRVMSVKNDIAAYRGGILSEFLENGQIEITDISFGEEIQKTNASDSGGDRRSSVFSVDASLERRVEIIKVTEQ